MKPELKEKERKVCGDCGIVREVVCYGLSGTGRRVGAVACAHPWAGRPSMGQTPAPPNTMNSAPGKSTTRSSGYHQKALAEIRNSLLPFANSGNENGLGSSAASTISTLSTTSGVSSASSAASNGLDKETLARQALVQLVAMGYSEVSIVTSSA